MRGERSTRRRSTGTRTRTQLRRDTSYWHDACMQGCWGGGLPRPMHAVDRQAGMLVGCGRVCTDVRMYVRIVCTYCMYVRTYGCVYVCTYICGPSLAERSRPPSAVNHTCHCYASNILQTTGLTGGGLWTVSSSSSSKGVQE